MSTVPVGFAPRITGLDEARRRRPHGAGGGELDAIAATTARPSRWPSSRAVLSAGVAAETRRFFERELFSRPAITRASPPCAARRAPGRGRLRRHLAVCFDACHMAVASRTPHHAARLPAAGISIGKVQVAPGSRSRPSCRPTRCARRWRRSRTRSTCTGQRALRAHCCAWVDLPEALEDLGDGARGTCASIHVPLFRERLGPSAAPSRGCAACWACWRRRPGRRGWRSRPILGRAASSCAARR